MYNVVSLCSYRKEKEVKELFKNFEEELARIGRRLHCDFVMFDHKYEPKVIGGLTHEEIISNKN